MLPDRSFAAVLALTIAVFLALAWAGSARAVDAAIPPLKARVTDTTRTLDAQTVHTLDARLAGLEKRKGAQIAVLMVPTTGGEAIEQYAVRAFEQWKLGRDKVDDGVLLVIAKDDRALRIEVGYGLEGAIPDLVAGRIINEQIVPRFKEGDFAGGVIAGVDSLIKRVDSEDLPAPHIAADENTDWWGLVFLSLMAVAANPLVAALVAGFIFYFIWQSIIFALVGAVVMFVISLLFNGARKGGGGGGRGGRGGWGSGGGFGGGGFGGGFGGGGGRSGGGGASGRW